jgi:DNA-binding transcriptional LysR family regulator
MMDALSLDQFAVFAAIVDEGSFAAAARHLNRAQSAITYAIQKLEDQSGTMLFDRSAYRPVLTEAGKELLPRIRRILADVENYRLHARQMVMGLEEELRLAVHPYTPTHVMSEALRDFHAAFPSVRIVAALSTKHAAMESLAQGTSDLATIIEATSPGEGFRRLPCTMLELVAVASPRHPLAQTNGLITPEMLREHMQLVIYEGLTQEEESRIRGYGIDSTEIWRVVNFAILRSLLVSGVGWGVVPLSWVGDDLAAGHLATLRIERWVAQKHAFTLPLVVAHATHRPLGPAGRWLFQKFAEIGGLTPSSPG